MQKSSWRRRAARRGSGAPRCPVKFGHPHGGAMSFRVVVCCLVLTLAGPAIAPAGVQAAIVPWRARRVVRSPRFWSSASYSAQFRTRYRDFAYLYWLRFGYFMAVIVLRGRRRGLAATGRLRHRPVCYRSCSYPTGTTQRVDPPRCKLLLPVAEAAYHPPTSIMPGRDRFVGLVLRERLSSEDRMWQMSRNIPD